MTRSGEILDVGVTSVSGSDDISLLSSVAAMSAEVSEVDISVVAASADSSFPESDVAAEAASVLRPVLAA